MDAAMMAQREPLLAGRYRMGRLLGSGGFGAVYLATDERLHRPVAIKVCSTRGMAPAEAAESARLFQSEALTLARLRHPGLTAIWDYFEDGDCWYLVMEYVPGETLRELLRRIGGPLPLAEALEYARQLCAVLQYLHDQHPPIVFRDLKPGNIMVTPDGQLKLIDFGIARLFSPGKAADTAQFGTPGYAPPEQYGGQTEPRSDVFSLGVVLHQMLTGHNPTTTPFALPPADALNPVIPPALAAVIRHATAYDLDARTASAEALRRQIEQALAQPASTTTTPAPSAPVMAVAVGANPSTSRRLWSPPPRTLPSRPQQSQGIGRTVALIFTILLLLAAIGGGVLLLRAQIGVYARELLAPGVVPGTSRSVVPAVAIFSAPGDDRSENLYEIDLAGGATRRLTELQLPETASQPAISPDGTQVAFNRERRVVDPQTGAAQITGSEVWVVDRETGELERVAAGYPFARAAAWSPDGQTLAIEVAEAGRAWYDHDIALIDLRTGASRALINTPQWEGGPAWSPDGTRIAFQSRPAGARCMQILVIDVTGGSPQPVTNLRDDQCQDRSSGAYWPDWSPDGAQIAFGLRQNGHEQLAVLTLQSGEIEMLNTGTQPSGYPRWSRDGRSLLFQRGRNQSIALFRYNLATARVEPINTSLPESHLADWR